MLWGPFRLLVLRLPAFGTAVYMKSDHKRTLQKKKALKGVALLEPSMPEIKRLLRHLRSRIRAALPLRGRQTS